APNSRPSSSLKESGSSPRKEVPSLVFVRGIPSLVFDLELPIPRPQELYSSSSGRAPPTITSSILKTCSSYWNSLTNSS
ncbi:Hypothetical protein FKW44_001015, partial [Caligus rogercresseyi]